MTKYDEFFAIIISYFCLLGNLKPENVKKPGVSPFTKELDALVIETIQKLKKIPAPAPKSPESTFDTLKELNQASHEQKNDLDSASKSYELTFDTLKELDKASQEKQNDLDSAPHSPELTYDTLNELNKVNDEQQDDMDSASSSSGMAFDTLNDLEVTTDEKPKDLDLDNSTSSSEDFDTLNELNQARKEKPIDVDSLSSSSEEEFDTVKEITKLIHDETPKLSKAVSSSTEKSGTIKKLNEIINGTPNLLNASSHDLDSAPKEGSLNDQPGPKEAQKLHNVSSRDIDATPMEESQNEARQTEIAYSKMPALIPIPKPEGAESQAEKATSSSDATAAQKADLPSYKQHLINEFKSSVDAGTAPKVPIVQPPRHTKNPSMARTWDLPLALSTPLSLYRAKDSPKMSRMSFLLRLDDFAMRHFQVHLMVRAQHYPMVFPTDRFLTDKGARLAVQQIAELYGAGWIQRAKPREECKVVTREGQGAWHLTPLSALGVGFPESVLFEWVFSGATGGHWVLPVRYECLETTAQSWDSGYEAVSNTELQLPKCEAPQIKEKKKPFGYDDGDMRFYLF